MQWLPTLGSSFHLELTGLARFLTLLSLIVVYWIFCMTQNNTQTMNDFGKYWGLMLLSLAALIGVFAAKDALLFYFCWELVLVPVYFLAALYGHADRKLFITSKLFIYTFVGSILMLIGIILVASSGGKLDFSYAAFINNNLSLKQESVAFWLIFIAFAIKIPIFPLHSWQPDAYSQAPISLVMYLSALVAKMGLFGIFVWLKPFFITAYDKNSTLIIYLALIGSLYAGFITLKQTTIRRWVAYCSIAHLGIMAAAAFAYNDYAQIGLVIQMFNHGINILGLWLLAYIFENYFKTTQIKDIGGLATKYPVLSILIFITLLANLALPLTNAFNGEFLMLVGIFRNQFWMGVIGVLSVIVTAIYTLTLGSKVVFGEATVKVIEHDKKLCCGYIWGYIFIAIFIFLAGIYPIYTKWNLF